MNCVFLALLPVNASDAVLLTYFRESQKYDKINIFEKNWLLWKL